jgi:ribonucleotide monophosphatase NagD (HAD superfamily)
MISGIFTCTIILDNPESDIAGANAAGWSSILVHTGVYSPSDGPPSHQPTFQAPDVEEAVNAVFTREAVPGQERGL